LTRRLFIAPVLVSFVSSQLLSVCNTIQSVGEVLDEYVSATFQNGDQTQAENDPQPQEIVDNEIGSANEIFDSAAVTNFLEDYYQYASGPSDSNLIDPLSDKETERIYILLSNIVKRAQSDPYPSRRPTDFLISICLKAHEALTSTDDLRDIGCGEGVNGCSVSTFLEPIENYGCWCYLGSRLTNGRGQPQDTYDTICRDLQLCLRCVGIDNAGSSCDPVTQTYVSTFTVVGTVNPISHCSNHNNNQCAEDVCCCEQQFLADLISTLFANPSSTTGWNSAYVHDGYQVYGQAAGTDGDFNTATCSSNPGNSASSGNLACCGTKPRRFPYSTQAGGRACCGETVYDTVTHGCCTDNIPRPGC